MINVMLTVFNNFSVLHIGRIRYYNVNYMLVYYVNEIYWYIDWWLMLYRTHIMLNNLTLHHVVFKHSCTHCKLFTWCTGVASPSIYSRLCGAFTRNSAYDLQGSRIMYASLAAILIKQYVSHCNLWQSLFRNNP